jgi:hypothetical protein
MIGMGIGMSAADNPSENNTFKFYQMEVVLHSPATALL